MSNDNRYLRLQHLTWSAVVEVPPSLRSVVGRRRLTRTLKTHDLATAKMRRFTVVKDLKEIIAQARRGLVGRSQMGEAGEWRRELEAAGAGEHRHGLEILLVDRAEAIEQADGLEAARGFHGIASGTLTPLDLHRDEWIQQSPYAERTKSDHKTALRRLEAWLEAGGKAVALETVTDREASRFRAALVDDGMHPRTIEKTRSGVRSYWNWLLASGYASGGNPWDGKALAKAQVRDEGEKERPFTDEEIEALFTGNAKTKPTRELMDAMAIAALSGLRLETIFQLTGADCAGGIFHVRKDKKGPRRVPIHAMLTSTVERLSAGKERTGFLFDANATGWDGARSMAFSKRFGAYRKKLGIHDKTGSDGGQAGRERRRSRVNFHSFRRWFITVCERTGQPEHLVARIVGHKITTMSYGVYSGGADMDQLRPVVNAVKLPEAAAWALRLKGGA